MSDPLIQFVKAKRKAVRMTQHDLADRAGVGLRFIRDLEQGKDRYDSTRSTRFWVSLATRWLRHLSERRSMRKAEIGAA